MLTDQLVSFVPVGAPLSLAVGVSDVASTNTYDILGDGVGTAPRNIIGNPASGLFGADPGIGANRPELNVTVGTAFVSAGGGTVNVKLQYSADTASTYQPAAWTTVVETGPIAIANLTAGAVIARFPFLPAAPASLRPRYVRLLFTVATATITAGTIASALVTTFRDDQANKYAAENFAV